MCSFTLNLELFNISKGQQTSRCFSDIQVDTVPIYGIFALKIS